MSRHFFSTVAKHSGGVLWFAIALCSPCAVAEDTMDTYLFANTDELRQQLQADIPAVPATRWLADPELRVKPERDARNLWTGTYSLRFRPTGRKERKAERELFHVENQLLLARWDKALASALAARYHRLIDLAEQEFALALAAARLRLQGSLLASEKALATGAGFSASRLQNLALGIELGEQELDRLHREAQQLRSDTVATYLVASTDERPAVSSRIVQPRDIANSLTVLVNRAPTTSADAAMAALEVQRAQHEVDLARRRTAFGLNLMEVGFEDKGVNSYNVTVGIRIPFGQRQVGSQRRVREFYAARQQAALTTRLLTDAIHDAARETQWEANAHAAFSASLKDVAVRMQRSTGNVTVLAALREHQLALAERAARSHINALRDYIDLLELAGMLQRQPLKNWLRGS